MNCRTILKGIGGLATAAAPAPLLATCSGGSPEGSTGGKSTSLGSGVSDPVPKSAVQAMVDAYQQRYLQGAKTLYAAQ